MPQKVFAMINELDELFTVQQLAELIHKKSATIYSDIIRRPNELPPIFRASPTSKPLFVNPRAWIMAKVNLQQEALSADRIVAAAVPEKKRRGRPSNLELRKRKEDAGKGGAA